MKKIILFCVFCVSLFLTSCSDGLTKLSYNWGKQVSFDNFLWCKYTPDTLKQRIVFDKIELDHPMILGLYDTYEGSDGCLKERAITSVAELFVNGERSSNHTFQVTSNDESIELGIVFLPEAKTKKYDWFLKIEDTGGADFIKDVDGEEIMIESGALTEELPAMVNWGAQYSTKMNPLAKGLMWICIFIAILLALWICILRPIFFDRFRVKRIVIEDKESERKERIRGAISLTMTSKYQKQGMFERIFVGKRLYYRDEFFIDGDIEIRPRNRKSVRVKAPDIYKMNQCVISREDNEPLVVINSNNKRKELRII